MNITGIFVVILCIGIVSLLAGVILLLFYFALKFICAKGSLENFIKKLFTTAYYIMQAVMVIFMLALAGMAIGMTIDGIGAGEYGGIVGGFNENTDLSLYWIIILLVDQSGLRTKTAEMRFYG